MACQDLRDKKAWFGSAMVFCGILWAAQASALSCDCGIILPEIENSSPEADQETLAIYYQEEDGEWVRVSEGDTEITPWLSNYAKSKNHSLPRASAFNRLSSSMSFRHEPTIYDAYNRDFEATNYTSPVGSSNSQIALTNTSRPIVLSFSQEHYQGGGGLTDINGISVEGFDYRAKMHASGDWNDFRTDDAGVYVPSTVAYLNSGNTLYGYDSETFSAFLALSSENTVSPTAPETVGLSFKSHFENGLAVTNTIGRMKEKGFLGLNSEKHFGFDKEMNNFFVVSDVQNKHGDTDYSARFESYLSPNSYQSRVMSWSNISVSKISFDIGYTWDSQRIGASVKSRAYATGQFNSLISGFENLDDFYHENEALELTYDSKINEGSSLNLKASYEHAETVSLNYKIKF